MIPRRTYLKRGKRPRWKSAKKVAELEAAVPVRVAIEKRSGGLCEVRFSAYCTGQATQIHHVLKQSQGGKWSEENCLASCWACNHEVELRPLDAQAAGVSRRRHPRAS